MIQRDGASVGTWEAVGWSGKQIGIGKTNTSSLFIFTSDVPWYEIGFLWDTDLWWAKSEFYVWKW